MKKTNTVENTIWSTKVQGISNLDVSREIRFKGDSFNKISRVLNVRKDMKILDTGCGPGTLTRRIHDLNKEVEIHGLDRDTNFIDYCKNKVNQLGYNVNYLVGDALKLPFNDNTFDLCMSHTVIEHVPNEEFLREQYRVCKNGGRVVVMNIRGENSLSGIDGFPPTEREKELLDKLDTGFEKVDEDNNVGFYSASPQQILKTFEHVGFRNLQFDVDTYVTCLDDSRNNFEDQIKLIEYEKNRMLDLIEIGINIDDSALTKDEIQEVKELTTLRFDKHLKTLMKGKKNWNFNIKTLVLISGSK